MPNGFNITAISKCKEASFSIAEIGKLMHRKLRTRMIKNFRRMWRKRNYVLAQMFYFIDY